MVIKFFYPVLSLLLFQVLAFLFYDGFRIEIEDSVKISVLLSYFSNFIAIFIFCLIFTFFFNKKRNFKFIEIDKRVNIFFIFLSVFFLLKPILVLNSIGISLGYDYLRIAYFQDPNIKKMVYGSEIINSITTFYIIPILWMYVIFLFNAKDRLSVKTFYFLLMLLVLFNLSYAGRINIVYAVLVLYFRFIFLGGGVLSFLKKYIPFLLFLLLISFIPLLLRSGEKVDDLEGGVMIELIEYHILQPFYLSQKIQLGYLDPTDDSYPFRLIIQAILSPFYFLLGYGGESLSYYYYQNNFLMDFSLSSKYSAVSYNAYATYMAYFYVDYGLLTPVFIFIVLMLIFFSSFLFLEKDLILKFLAYIALMLYSSMFMGGVFAPGPLFLLILTPWFVFLYKMILKRWNS